jgi:hypothetical protein
MIKKMEYWKFEDFNKDRLLDEVRNWINQSKLKVVSIQFLDINPDVGRDNYEVIVWYSHFS